MEYFFLQGIAGLLNYFTSFTSTSDNLVGANKQEISSSRKYIYIYIYENITYHYKKWAG